MSENIYTKEQVINGGLEIINILMEFCGKTGDSESALKSELMSIDNEKQIHQKQQEALNNLSDISGMMSTDASSMIDASKQTSSDLETVVDQFSGFSTKVQEIEKKGTELTSHFNALTKQIDTITKFVSTIQEISAHTSLLSFNASIEAAHAGEAGKGFRIIANEVKKLSESTDTMSKKISDNIRKLNEDILALVEENKANTNKLKELEAQTEKSVKLIDEVRHASEKQTESTMNMINRLEQSQKSIEDTISSVKDVEKLNQEKIKEIEKSGVNTLIQVNDRISFLIELEQIFKYLKAELN